MQIGKRNLSKLIKALFAKRHYIALFNIFLICYHPFNCLKRYFLGLGAYPAKILLRTPSGKIDPEIYSYYDMLTINEIFCRVDYKAKNNISTVVDIGSNIGISALYFLTRNNYCKCHLFEPDPANIIKLNNNLKNFKGRYILREFAIDRENGFKRFGRDPAGRYGGLNRETGNYINVKCCDINGALRDILESGSNIDILKIDIEGDEINVLRSIDKKLLDKIKNIFFEIDHTINLNSSFSFYPEIFFHKRFGETFRLINKKFI